MPEVEQCMEQLPRAVAGQLPKAVADNDARVAKARRNAWILAGVAVFFYVAYMAWMAVRANGV